MAKKRIAPRSSKRSKQEREYAKLREDKKKFMVENKHYNCIFCNTKLEPLSDDNVGWHHLNGRDGELLTEWHNILPAHNLCHSDFHHKHIGQLLKTTWYSHFLVRLENLNTAFGDKAYNVELARMNKGGKMDNETYFRLMK